MLLACHSLAYLGEQLEVAALAGQQWVRLKVRNDPSNQEWKASHLPLERPIASVWSYGPALEVLLHQQQHF